jgi:DNA-binding CsgD family transcriptional regulator
VKRIPSGNVERILDPLKKGQPGVGVLIIDEDGLVLYCNQQARQIYYGNNFNPVGLTIEAIEGPEFAAERMPVIQQVIRTRRPVMLRHIRGGRWTEAVIWPMEPVPDRKARIISVTRQGVDDARPDTDYAVEDSGLVDLGPLDVLTRRELEVLTLVGHGTPLKSIAKELDVSRRTVERYRTDIARKLGISSIAEIAKLVQLAGLEIEHADMPRLNRWREGFR